MKLNGITETIQRALAAAGLNTQSGPMKGVTDTIHQALSAAGLTQRSETSPPAAHPSPLSQPAQPEARAVHQQMHRLGTVASFSSAARPWAGHLQGRGPSAQGGVVRHRQIEAEQADEGADQAFGLPERQAEDGAQGQGRQDGERRIPGLPAPGRAGLGCPRSDRLLGEPDRQAAALA